MDEKEEKRKRLEAELPQFYNGTGNWYRHAIIRNMLWTDGVAFLAEVAGAYWLIDEIGFLNKRKQSVRDEEFQVWILRVKDERGRLTCDDGNGNVVFSKDIEFTDFPLDEIKLYFENNVLMLPSER